MSVLPRWGGGGDAQPMDFQTGATLVQPLAPEFLWRMLFNTACLILNIIRLKKMRIADHVQETIPFCCFCTSAKYRHVPQDALIIQDFVM